VREPALGLKTSLLNGGSFLKRIRENLQSVWRLPWVPLPAGQAAIHLLDEHSATTLSAAQVGSTLLHIILCVALLWTAVPRHQDPPHPPPGNSRDLPSLSKWLVSPSRGSLGKQGSSGGHDDLPPTLDRLAPPARAALIPPQLADSHPHPLTVAVTIADVEAPDIVRPVSDIGLPWMKEKNNSSGRGENGVGNGDQHGMGDGPGNGAGVGNEAGPFGIVATQVLCKVCPDPLYSDEARKIKLQGSVLLRVLVGTDGRAHDVRVTRGLGGGLDESAMQAVRSWIFMPARDATRRPIASWIQIETSFRLF
jgi:TonB family protein